MHRIPFAGLVSSLILLVSVTGCIGGVGTTCFQDNECNGALICCHLGSVFNQGSCQTSAVCNEMRGTGGTGGTGAS
ncbi:MAG: hypothetical protein WBG86_13050, partial [Polyangiales bacterium]